MFGYVTGTSCFPVATTKEEELLEESLLGVVRSKKLSAFKPWMTKVLQLYQLSRVYQGDSPSRILSRSLNFYWPTLFPDCGVLGKRYAISIGPRWFKILHESKNNSREFKLALCTRRTKITLYLKTNHLVFGVLL